ncbi:MAG TPA: site-specific DNA-methyltransferase [Allosphingosinicella sp.]
MPELQFKGKEFVYNHHLTVPFRPLEIHPEKGIGEARLDGNLIVQGDNLHALKALLPMYAGQIDCIFIDPPYNTGNEGWSYNDNVNSPMIREWLSDNPIGLEDGLRHDKWACMMWPRLKLLHDLLAETGSFWMTLDENEIQHARCILDEIFCSDNFVDTVIWHKNYAPKATVQYFSSDHDYLLVYAKNINNWLPRLLERTGEQDAVYRNPDNDPRGRWRPNNLAARNYYSKGTYPITTPSGRVIPGPPQGSYWRVSEDKLRKLDADNRIWWGEDGSNVPAPKIFLSEVREGRVPQTLWHWSEVGHTQEAKRELLQIFSDRDDVFISPKPSRLIKRVIEIALDPDAQSTILDSFAGSGTTAQAVLAANASDGGSRRFILVEGEDYADTLTAERVRRVINGYDFTGTEREELLRESLTFTKLRNANTLMERVQRIETLDGPKYDRIAKTVKEGALVVIGERDVAERTPGLGGEFTYCTLGSPVEMDAILSGRALPDEGAMAGLLWHTATATPLEPAGVTQASAIGEGIARLGTHSGRTLWLIYRPDLDWLKSADAALSLSKARAIAESAPGNHLVFAPAKFVSRELLVREQIDVDYAPLPFALYRLETA